MGDLNGQVLFTAWPILALMVFLVAISVWLGRKIERWSASRTAIAEESRFGILALMRSEPLQRTPDRLRMLRWLAGAAIVLTLLEVGYSNMLWETMEEYQKELMGLNGLDALVSLPYGFLASYWYVQILVLAALLIPIKYADNAFYINLLVYETAFLFSGFVIGSALQSFIMMLLGYLYGAILFVLLSHRLAPGFWASSRASGGRPAPTGTRTRAG